ncbi:MAG: flagellar FliJ family protein [Burkholderiaceae bacterium]
MSLSPKLLDLLIRLRERQRDDQARNTQRASSAHRQAVRTADSLAQFEAEQFERRRRPGTREFGVQSLRIDQGFHRKLGEARRLQDEVLKTSEASAESELAALMIEQRRLAALETLLSNRERAARLRSLRDEQRDLDEHNARVAANKPQD